MRTTLTLDDDVAAKLKLVMRKRGDARLRVVVNDALRRGLDALETPPARAERFSTRVHSLGPSLVGSLDNIEEVLSRVEGEHHA